MMTLDRTHDAELRSWVASANGHVDFPIQNLPLGVFSAADGDPRVGVAIGDSIFDVRAAALAGLFTGEAVVAANLCLGATLNELMGAPPSMRRILRAAVSGMLAVRSDAEATIKHARPNILREAAECTMHLPARIGGFTDFFAGLHHAVTAGRMLRPANPLLPNYKHVPIAYNSRASTIGVSPARVRRPQGQVLPTGATQPLKRATERFDYEFELGVWIGRANSDGEPIDISRAGDVVFGYCTLNDWSSRDIQRWEAQPLGPFLAKSTATTISPWIITPEALAPFRAPQPKRDPGDPAPLPYLWDDPDQAHGALAVNLEILLRTSRMRAAKAAAERISSTDALSLYWTPAQLVAHHSVNGCILNPGDIFGTGTISGDEGDSAGCLLEHTQDGEKPLTLGSGEQRRYLEDGDEVTLRAHCKRKGFASIGFGDNRGEITPAAPR
jgi:fumarylacetoacetase